MLLALEEAVMKRGAWLRFVMVLEGGCASVPHVTSFANVPK